MLDPSEVARLKSDEERGRETRRIFIERCLNWKMEYMLLADVLSSFADPKEFSNYYQEYVTEIDPLMEAFFNENWNFARIVSHSDAITREVLRNPDRQMFRTRGSYAPVYYAMIRILKPQRVVETGVWYGMSSFSILHALKRNGSGHLWSIDINANPLIGSLVSPDLRPRWTLITGDATTELPKLLEQLHKVDVVVLDDEHSLEHVTLEVNSAWPRLSEKGLLVADDIDWHAADFFTKFASGKRSCQIQRLPAGIDGYGANFQDPVTLNNGRRAKIGFVLK